MNDLTMYLSDRDVTSDDLPVKIDSLIDVGLPAVKDVLDILLQDKSTKTNIIWATDAYDFYDKGCGDTDNIRADVFFSENPVVLVPRTRKAVDEQQQRTRSKAEVFTPVWICNRMNNVLDEQWFGRKDVFNSGEDESWVVTDGPIEFPEGKTWKSYVDSRRLEITCGEAPYLVSRYDAATGDFILPLSRRVGILDRKIRIVSENTSSLDEWIRWTERAFQSCYGYEWQGDSLLIARINMLMTFYDYFKERWNCDPEPNNLKRIANIIAWNLWQMDGLTGTVPFGKPVQQTHQMTLFDDFGNTNLKRLETSRPSKIYDWRRDNSVPFDKCKLRGKMDKKLFDFVIGNPPYQQEFTDEGNKSYAAPIYHKFMDSAFQVGDVVELIHPARFLFNAGSTPKAWNQRMLDDAHFKVLFYEPDPRRIFPNAQIQGGVAVTIRDSSKILGPIGVFTQYDKLNSIISKVSTYEGFQSIESEVISRTAYRLTEKLHHDHPEAVGQLSDGHAYDMSSNIFERLPQVFYSECPKDDRDYVCMLGRENGERIYKFIRREYIVFSTPLS